MMQISPNDVLVIVDPQLDFCPGGALAVKDGDLIMAPISELAARFPNVVVTQDYHPKGHSSFASQHEGKEPFDVVEMIYGPQVLWPDHCVQGSKGAEFHPDILPAVALANMVIRKGMNPKVDSYSAFVENDKATRTGLGGYLRARGIKRAFFVGLAYDFCVGYSALDGMSENVESVVIRDLSRAIAMSIGNSGRTTVDDIEERFHIANVKVIDSGDLA